MPRPVRLACAAAALAMSALALSACEDDDGVYTVAPGNGQQSVAQARTGWSTVKPIAVHLPTDDPINDGAVPDDSTPTIVNLWASWCDPCKTELPLLESVAKSGKVHVIGFSRDTSKSSAESALKRFGVTYPNWMDTDLSLVVELDRRVPFGAVPSSVLIRDGKVVAAHIGDFKNKAEVLAALEIK